MKIGVDDQKVETFWNILQHVAKSWNW